MEGDGQELAERGSASRRLKESVGLPLQMDIYIYIYYIWELYVFHSLGFLHYTFLHYTLPWVSEIRKSRKQEIRKS